MAPFITVSDDETRFAIPSGAIALLERMRDPSKMSQDENSESRVVLMDVDVINLSTRCPILAGTCREWVRPIGRRASRYTALQLIETTVKNANVKLVALSMKVNLATHRIWLGIRIESA